jgi:signal transduction histidine kinase
MIIEDDGVGFNPEIPRDRNGLLNLKARAASLKGTLNILSDTGKGTKLRLEFPIG